MSTGRRDKAPANRTHKARLPSIALLFLVLVYGEYRAFLLYMRTDHEDVPEQIITKQHRKRHRDDFVRAFQQLSHIPKESTQRVAFVTFSYVKPDHANHLHNFLLPAVDTWAAPVEGEPSSGTHGGTMLYVVLSNSSRDAFEKNCEDQKLCKRLRPIYVDCPEGHYGESPCCKQQKGLLALHEGLEYPLYDWYAYFDDDVYLRKEYIAEILRQFANPDFPMAAAPRSNEAKPLGHLDNMCSNVRGDEFKYPWGMPIFYSRGAIATLAKGFRAGSLVKQCTEFMVTHDIGNQILNWMYSLPIAKLPPMNMRPKRDDFIGSHWVGRKDMEEIYHLQPRRPEIPKEEPLPKGAFSFYETHKQWLSPEMKSPEMHDLFASGVMWYHNVTGYRQTLTYAHHREPGSWKEGVWHTMKLSDCNPERRGGNSWTMTQAKKLADARSRTRIATQTEKAAIPGQRLAHTKSRARIAAQKEKKAKWCQMGWQVHC